jgi:hypothetical protein
MDSKEFIIASQISDTKNITYIVTINNYLSYDRRAYNASSVIIGGEKRGCVCISVNYVDKTSLISHYEYNEKCSIKRLLNKGDGTRNMLMSIITITREHFYPEIIRTLNLEDDSHIFNNYGKRVNLYWSYYVTYGKTYYEYWFNAQVLSGDEKRLYDNNREKLNTKLSISFDEFTIYIAKNIYYDSKMMSDIKSIFDKIVSEEGTWHDLFSLFDKNIIYNCIGSNLDNICIKLKLFMPKMWYIDLDTFVPIKYTKELSGGNLLRGYLII